MLGVPLMEFAYVLGDNQSVLCNTTMPESTLKKKSNAMSYHFVCEGVAMDAWRTTYEPSASNPANMLTKSLPYGKARNKYVRFVLYDI